MYLGNDAMLKFIILGIIYTYFSILVSIIGTNSYNVLKYKHLFVNYNTQH